MSGVQAEIQHHAVVYTDWLNDKWIYAIAYLFVTCTPPFLSSYSWMRALGIATVLALVFSAWLKFTALVSVWCAVEAMISWFIYLHFRRMRRLESNCD